MYPTPVYTSHVGTVAEKQLFALVFQPKIVPAAEESAAVELSMPPAPLLAAVISAVFAEITTGSGVALSIAMMAANALEFQAVSFAFTLS